MTTPSDHDAVAAVEYVDRGRDRIALHVYPDPDGNVETAVVVFPAMGTPARYYRPFAQQLRSAGLAVVVADLRGTGASTPAPSRRSGYGYGELAGDVGAVLDALKPRLDGRRVVLLGHSLGGQACALHLALTRDDRVAGLALVAVGLPWYRLYRGRRKWAVLALTQPIVVTATLLRVWPGWAFGGRQARRVMQDWGYTARHGRYRPIDGVDVETALAGVRTPTLAISVDDDQFTPGSTLDHLCAKMTTARIDRVHIAAADAGAPLDHFAWIRASRPIIDAVARFATNLAP